MSGICPVFTFFEKPKGHLRHQAFELKKMILRLAKINNWIQRLLGINYIIKDNFGKKIHKAAKTHSIPGNYIF